MKIKLLSAAFLLCALLGNSVSAQKSDIRFRHLTINDGLSQSAVNCIMQDAAGFMWIGTQDGLNRYDGYRFKVFKKDRTDSATLNSNYVWALYEDEDRILWVGTEGGLHRYDPSTETFTRYVHDLRDPNSLNHDIVWSIRGAANGKLWVGTPLGLDRFDPRTGQFEHINAGPSNVGIRSLFKDSRENLWIGTQGDGLWRYHAVKKEFTAFRYDSLNPISISSDVVWSITEDREQNLWVGTNDGVNRVRVYDENCFFDRFYADASNPSGLGNNTVVSVYTDQHGTIWTGSFSGGLNKIHLVVDGEPEFQRFVHNDNLPYSLQNDLVQTICEDHSGNIWVGHHNGLDRFDPAKQAFTHHTMLGGQENGLPDKNVWCFAEGEGILWIGTRFGLTRKDLSSGEYRHFTRETHNVNRLNDRSLLSMHIGPEGALYTGWVDGVYKVSFDASGAPVWEPIIYRDSIGGLADNRVYELAEDSHGNLWIGTREGLARYHFSSGDYRFFEHDRKDPTSIGSSVIREVHEDHQGRIWIGTDGGGLNLLHSEMVNGEEKCTFTHYRNDPNDETTIPSDEVMGIVEDDRGMLYLGTYGGGLCRFDPNTGIGKTFTEKDGLSNDVIYGLILDDDNYLWLSTNFGLSRFNLMGETFRNFTEADGLQSNEFNIEAYYRNADGRMYFGGINGYNAFYAEEIRANEKPPRMVITDIKLSNRSIPIGPGMLLERHVSLTDTLTLRYNQNNLTIDFAALHYTNPGKNQYRYIMEGWDEDWNYVGNRQSAYYNYLEPGEYVFRVEGTNSDGLWAEEAAVIEVHITPPFWQTWWFRIVFILFAIAIALGILRYRISIIKAQKRKLEVLVANRTREVEMQKEQIEAQKESIEVEKEKAENLLLNILPAETVEELKANGKATARNYRRATVLFTDFKSFTSISEHLKPNELVNELDRHFVEFDRIIDKWGIEKIKTIGDAYMAAGGVPIRNKSNPIDAVLAALEINRYVLAEAKEKEAKGAYGWPLRIGVHTGEIIAGVIGTKRFAYDIWGDAVNVANRMETSGEPGKVNVSGATFEIVSPLFDCTYRGKVAAKNKGEVDMFFVDGIKPELSVDSKGEEPNAQFWNYVNLLLYSTVNYRHAERHALKLLETKLPDNLHYHGIHHTKDVCRAAEMYGHYESISGEELYLLKTAALYHDAGFINQYSQNEPLGVELSREALPNFGYTDEQIEQVSKLILATAVPHNPTSHLEEIMCDADLDYLGRKDFWTISETLKQELRERDIVKSDRQWDEIQVKFFKMHRFFTKTAIRMRKGTKLKHLEEIKLRLEKGGYPDGS